MGLFGARAKLRKREKRTALQDARAVSKESGELRRQISRDLLNPARVTARQISANLGHVDRQLTVLERLRGQVRENRTQYGVLTAEKARLKEHKKALKTAAKLQRLGSSGKAVSGNSRIRDFLKGR